MASPLVELMQAPDRAALEGLLAEDTRFHSPVADYQGRADVAHLLSLIASIVRDVQPTRELEDGETRATFIDAMVEDTPLQGVFLERYDDDGELVDVTLMLRPLAGLQVALGAMAAALEASPLPSTRG
jgi:hypothetical protein